MQSKTKQTIFRMVGERYISVCKRLAVRAFAVIMKVADADSADRTVSKLNPQFLLCEFWMGCMDSILWSMPLEVEQRTTAK